LVPLMIDDLKASTLLTAPPSYAADLLACCDQTIRGDRRARFTC
jgi:hypothetical protein